jgi:hypothetical protein
MLLLNVLKLDCSLECAVSDRVWRFDISIESQYMQVIPIWWTAPIWHPSVSWYQINMPPSCTTMPCACNMWHTAYYRGTRAQLSSTVNFGCFDNFRRNLDPSVDICLPWTPRMRIMSSQKTKFQNPEIQIDIYVINPKIQIDIYMIFHVHANRVTSIPRTWERLRFVVNSKNKKMIPDRWKWPVYAICRPTAFGNETDSKDGQSMVISYGNFHVQIRFQTPI